MAGALDAVDEPHWVGPPDVFLEMAGRRPTFLTRSLLPGDPERPNPF